MLLATHRGSVLLPSLMPISSPRRIAFDLSELLENLLKGLNGSEGAIRRVTGLLPRPFECSRGGECLVIKTLSDPAPRFDCSSTLKGEPGADCQTGYIEDSLASPAPCWSNGW